MRGGVRGHPKNATTARDAGTTALARTGPEYRPVDSRKAPRYRAAHL